MRVTGVAGEVLLGWHGGAGAAFDLAEELAGGWVAGDDDRAVVAAFEGGVVRIEAEAGLGLPRAVARDAPAVEDGGDVLGEARRGWGDGRGAAGAGERAPRPARNIAILRRKRRGRTGLFLQIGSWSFRVHGTLAHGLPTAGSSFTWQAERCRWWAWTAGWRCRERRCRRATPAGRRLAGDRGAAALPELRRQRHHVARAARRARRPQARAAAHPLRDVRQPAPLPRRQVPQVRDDRRRRARQVPPARRLRLLRRDGAHGADFSLRVPLVDGHGNFGSLDGDAPAAYRYTEARLRPAGHGAAATRSSQGTVDWRPNYDGTHRGADRAAGASSRTCWSTARTGIAVGMATNIPPHNLREVLDGCRRADRRPQTSRPRTCSSTSRVPTSRRAARSSTARRSCARSTSAGRARSRCAASGRLERAAAAAPSTSWSRRSRTA